MTKIRINVNKQMDGYTFSILPTTQKLIKELFPSSHPANLIFVAYDTRSNFESIYGRIERHIYPALLGIDNRTDIHRRIDEIQFVDTQTGKVVHTLRLSS